MNVTVNAAAGRIPPPPKVMPGAPKNPVPPPNNAGAAGARLVITAALPTTPNVAPTYPYIG